MLILAPPCGLIAGRFASTVVDRFRDPAQRPLAFPAVELLTAGLFAAVAGLFDGWRVLPPFVLVVALVALSTIDLYVYRLPDAVVFAATGVSALAMLVVAFGIDRPAALGRAAVGALGYFVILLALHLISPRGMGFGDVKFALLLGLHLGWIAGSTYVAWSTVFRLIFFALVIGCFLGAIIGVAVALARRSRPIWSNSFPFGPALAAGTMIVVLFPGPFAGP